MQLHGSTGIGIYLVYLMFPARSIIYKGVSVDEPSVTTAAIIADIAVVAAAMWPNVWGKYQE